MAFKLRCTQNMSIPSPVAVASAHFDHTEPAAADTAVVAVDTASGWDPQAASAEPVES